MHLGCHRAETTGCVGPTATQTQLYMAIYNLQDTLSLHSDTQLHGVTHSHTTYRARHDNTDKSSRHNGNSQHTNEIYCS